MIRVLKGRSFLTYKEDISVPVSAQIGSRLISNPLVLQDFSTFSSYLSLHGVEELL